MLIQSRLLYRRLRRLRMYQRKLLAVISIIFLVDAFLLIRHRPPTLRQPLHTQAHEAARPNTTVFIASVHRNTDDVLKRAWNDAIMHLVSALGTENVYFSAIESGSQDDTKKILKLLKGRLNAAGVSNTITLGMTVMDQLKELEARPENETPREEAAGWIWNKEDEHYDLRRIPYLSRVRNQAMEPLEDLARQGRRFDKILWVNDVVFDTEDIMVLLNTRDGRYGAACSMDFKTYPYYYDTFALRDDEGQKTASYFWPWFSSNTARGSALRGEPIKVFSCWNGIVVFDAEPFYANPPLRFRGIDDSLADLHLEASECCLIHADNPLSTQPNKGVWLNPNVRVGYNVTVYEHVKGGRFPGPGATVIGAWANRWMRIKNLLQYALENQTVQSRLSKWRSATPPGEATRSEPGEPCLINEMQIMWQNGWRHL